MAGKYTEAQKRASKKYCDKQKAQGVDGGGHGTNEKARRRMYILGTYKFIKKLFEEKLN